MTETSSYERAILDRHAEVQQTLAIWTGVGMALVFSYAGALFTFLAGQPLWTRLLAYGAFVIAYGTVVYGTRIVGATLWQHVRELEKLKENGEISGLGDWIISNAEQFGRFNRYFGQGTFVVFLIGLFLVTLAPLG